MNCGGKLREGKMKSVRILSVSVVIAAAGMVAAGCDINAGAGSSYNEAESAQAPASGSAAGGTMAGSASATKAIKVKFEVMNGGHGLYWSEGIVATQDNSRLIYGSGVCSNDYTVTIIAPADDGYLNIYWMCFENIRYYCRAKMKAESGTIILDFNGWTNWDGLKIATKNLYDVECFWDENHDGQEKAWWEDLKKRAGSNEFEGGRRIKVKFEVKNGGAGLLKSEGIVSTQDDISYLVYDHDVFANDFTITLPVPKDDEYLNVRWRGVDGFWGATYVRARMKAESGTITLDYNGVAMGPKVATKNLSDVAVGDYYYGENTSYRVCFGPDWEDAKKRAADD